MSLTPLRDRILGNLNPQAPALVIDVPEWQTQVGVRRLTLTERLVFEATNGAIDSIDIKIDRARYHTWLLRYVIATACDEKGQRLFRVEDEAALRDAPYTALERLGIAALRVNAVSGEELEALGKRSGEALNGASPSDSPATSGSSSKM